jgi:quercetin dioxygenase-like cupin family protein
MNRSIAPDEQIHLDPTRAHSLTVTAGVLYVWLDDDDLVLTPGDSVTIAPAARVRAWNAGDETASVVHYAATDGCPQELLLAA